jgi:diaminohydroxyphosphoribosylaminopyrimidine deaminase / 5-amino-6-(5-phosphoribosylamino)uracil reductase
VKPAAFSAIDERFMRRALLLAERGRGTTRPNPTVGAVIVRNGRVVGQGFHERAGGPHAEIAALARVRGNPRGTTMYVTLEPCCHTGRTGPCTEAILKARPSRVVVGCRDPNPLVDGRGIARLRRAGIRVDMGCLEAEARAAVRAYATWIAEKRPLVTLKVAATLDGYIADAHPRRGRAPVFLTGPAARRVAHELRAAHDAVLVGAGTARADDPRLTVRLPGHDPAAGPLRVLLAGRRPLPARLKMLRGRPEPIVIPRGQNVRRALEMLARDHDVQSVLVEGGATVHGAFIAAGLVDRVALFLAPRLIGGGVPIARGADLPLAKALRLGPLSTRTVGQDLLITADVLS